MNGKMKKYLPYILATILLVGLIVMVQTQKPLQGRSSGASFAQEAGYFFLPPGSANTSDVTVEQYSKLVSEFQTKYMLPVFKVTGKPLLIPAEWENPYFAGFAIDRKSHMQVSLWGGMARAPGASIAILAGVLCHEVGHVIAGEPRQTIPGAEWSSIEGLSDYYAGLECLPEFLQKHTDIVPVPSAEALQVCNGHELCARTVTAGLELVQFFQKYDSQKSAPVSLFSPAPAAQELIRNLYPSTQCRLDSIVEGARCHAGGTCQLPVCWATTQQ